MVRALLDGSKTQTRRVFKLPRGCSWYEGLGSEREGWLQDDTGPGWWHVSERRCPYDRPGERLWVREAWSTHACFDDVPPSQLTKRSLHYWADGDIHRPRSRSLSAANAPRNPLPRRPRAHRAFTMSRTTVPESPSEPSFPVLEDPPEEGP